MAETPVYSVGLGGDGDEIWAIEDVEAAFGVRLDGADASRWVTAGDVFRSLLEQLLPAEATNPDNWSRFVTALASQTGIDPALLTPESPLLGGTRVWAVLSWIPGAILLGIVAFLVVAALASWSYPAAFGT